MVSAPLAKRRMTDEPKMDDARALLGLVPLVTKEEHLFWAEKIKPHVPHCITMYNNLVQHGRGLVSHDTFYVLRGHPSSLAVICDKKIMPRMQHLGIFCLEEEVDQLIEVLGSSPIISWEDAIIVIHHIPPYLVGPLQWLVEQSGVKMDLSRCMTFTYDPHVDTEPLRVGQGLRVCRLGRAGVRHLLENAKYGKTIPLELMYNLAQHVPYLGVYWDAAKMQATTIDVVNLSVAGDEEVPVAWACSTPTGDVGKLVTEEGFRRRGLGGLLSTTLARQQAALLGFIPHAFIEADNSASRAMFIKNAGWSFTHDAFWLTTSNQGSEPEDHLLYNLHVCDGTMPPVV